MTPRQKFDAIFYIISVVLTAAFVCIGFLAGVRVLVFLLLAILALVIIALAIVFTGPILEARRQYSARPPRKMYEELSSKEGYCRFETLPAQFFDAICSAEDPRFYRHKGIDPHFLINAIARFLLCSEKPIGASSITQQLIKNVYLTPEASFKRKFIEMAMVPEMEKELSKKEIIELYVNIIYYGCGQYGIRNAARYYYDIEPGLLNFDQSISLAAILPCPDKYNKAANPLYFNQRKIKTLCSMYTYSDIPLDKMKIDLE